MVAECCVHDCGSVLWSGGICCGCRNLGVVPAEAQDESKFRAVKWKETPVALKTGAKLRGL